MTDDAVQLRQFVEKGDEEAFCKLVSRHFALVYGTALRLTNHDASLAEDVAQTVFTDLARKARHLPRGIILPGWLYQATRFAGAKAVRGEQRRRAREQEAFLMQELAPETSPEWERIRPVLDAAVGKLSRKDRDAILLHYFEQKSFRDVGAALGLTDDAAQKRVSRALEKLRTILARLGITVPGSALSNFLEAVVVPLVPAGKASTIAKCSLKLAAATGPANVFETLTHGLTSSTARIAAACLLTVLAGGALKHFAFAAHSAQTVAFTKVNLSAYYNGGLDKSWTPDYGNNHLAELGEGERVLRGVPFETQGLVQLQGAEWKRRGYNFPEAVAGIPVGVVGRRIHLLHANSAYADPAGTTVANLVLHYSDGEQTDFPIRQGVELLDWWEWPRAPVKKPTNPNTVVAWKGVNPAAEHQGARIRLFDTVFTNPHPDKLIQSIDYDSAMAGSAPFMVALTVEQ
jgi:RNA polymerase sigma factor (sigma-70 family)